MPNIYSIHSDEELMFLIHGGETGAFDELYIRYGQRLLVYFTRMLNFDRDLAQDALQDIFLKIAEAPEKFDRNRSFKTWVFCMAHNACKNYYRHQAVVNNSRDELWYEQDESYNQVEQLIRNLDHQKFMNALEIVLLELPPEKKEVFILRYQEQKSIAEIATIQDCATGSVKSRLHYTLKLLEEKLKLYKPVKE